MRIIFVTFLFLFSQQAWSQICDQTNPRYFLRGDINSQGKGARIWSLENLGEDLRRNPDNSCANETYLRAAKEQKEYWDNVKLRSGCPKVSRLKASCEEIELNLMFIQSMNRAKERALAMEPAFIPQGCRGGSCPGSRPESQKTPGEQVIAKCQMSLDKKFGPEHGYKLASNPGFNNLGREIAAGALSCLQGLGDEIIRTVSSTVQATKGMPIGIKKREGDALGYLLYRVDSNLKVSGNSGNANSSPLPITETMLGQDIHGIINFEFDDPETKNRYSGSEGIARAAIHGIKQYIRQSGTIYNCLDSTSQSPFLCDAIASIGTSFIGIRAVAQFGSKMAIWKKNGFRGPQPKAPHDLDSRIPVLTAQILEGESIPGGRAQTKFVRKNR